MRGRPAKTEARRSQGSALRAVASQTSAQSRATRITATLVHMCDAVGLQVVPTHQHQNREQQVLVSCLCGEQVATGSSPNQLAAVSCRCPRSTDVPELLPWATYVADE
ncbi:MAG: hypothetical protein C5B48_05960 [Candidatus Rokuibacteriota bacterium]|nr:MAG: hypothetical protein C5B48_05960 [Candidatus Rokubacteria bacterium]